MSVSLLDHKCVGCFNSKLSISWKLGVSFGARSITLLEACYTLIYFNF